MFVDCSGSVKNVMMMCNDSRRCLDDSMRCDTKYAKNCHSEKYPLDLSDIGWRYPAQCIGKFFHNHRYLELWR